MYCQFSVWYCPRCSVAPLTDYANNKIYRELPRLNKIYTDINERLFLNLRRGQDYTGELEKIPKHNAQKKMIKGNWLLPR